MVAELTGDTPPDFGDVTILLTSCTPGEDRDVCTTVTDENCSGGPAGVASVEVCYTVDGGAETCVALAQDGDEWCGTIPGQPTGSEVNYYYKATDVEDLEITTVTYTYFIWEASAPILAVYNTADYPEWISSYYMYNAVDACGCPYPYDWWYVPSLGPVGPECVGDYEVIIWIEGSFPSSDMPREAIGEWLAEATPEEHRAFFLSSQDYGCWCYGCETVDFEPGDFEYDFLGIDVFGPQDVGGGSADPYPVDADPGHAVFGSLDAHPGQLNYYPGYELDFGNWIDTYVPTGDAVVAFTDPQTDGVCGVSMHAPDYSWATAFLPFDVLAMDWLEPYYDWIILYRNLIDMDLDHGYPDGVRICIPPKLSLLKGEPDECGPCDVGADHIFIKPDTDHTVCVYLDDVCGMMEINTIHFFIRWNGDIQFKFDWDFDCTLLDSLGWDIKEHQDPTPGVGEDWMEVYLIGGGNAQELLAEDGCIMNIHFHTQAGVQPGDQDTIHFDYAFYNEGLPMRTNDFYETINRPPVMTWFGCTGYDCRHCAAGVALLRVSHRCSRLRPRLQPSGGRFDLPVGTIRSYRRPVSVDRGGHLRRKSRSAGTALYRRTHEGSGICGVVVCVPSAKTWNLRRFLGRFHCHEHL